MIRLMLIFLPILISQPSFAAQVEFPTQVPVVPEENSTDVDVVLDTLSSPAFFASPASDEFTPAEKAALEKFRPLVEPILTKERSDAFLMTWLRAKDLNIKEAEKMLASYQKWRAEYKLDGITNEIIYDFRPKPFDVSGWSREGLPVAVIAPGHLDLATPIKRGEREKLFRYIIQMVESAMVKRGEASRRAGKPVQEVVAIVDFEGFNLKDHGCVKCTGVLKDLYLAFEVRYPGIMRHVIAINVPKIALPFVGIVKPLISKQNAKGLRFFGPDKKEWTTYISKIVDLDQLPVRFGGTRVESHLLSAELPDSVAGTTEPFPYTTEDPDTESI